MRHFSALHDRLAALTSSVAAIALLTIPLAASRAADLSASDAAGPFVDRLVRFGEALGRAAGFVHHTLATAQPTKVLALGVATAVVLALGFAFKVVLRGIGRAPRLPRHGRTA